MKTKVLVKDLKQGMFVFELDRPWLDTPYLIQGFTIESEDDIRELAKYCEYVYIDPLKGQFGTHVHRSAAPRAAGQRVQPVPAGGANFRGNVVYRDARLAENEIPAAKEARSAANEIVTKITAGMEKGLNLDVASAQNAVEGLRESIVRNPDALLFLTRLRDTKSSAYNRAINVAVYLLAFGRHLGFSKEDLSALGLAGLLLDVGKLQLPPELLDKSTNLTPQEYNLLKRHVAFGEKMLREAPGITDKLIQIVSEHHERENGSGYPRGVAADQISVHGKMAAIVDCYEELVIQRAQGTPVPPHEALQLIHSWGGRYFHPTLVEAFIQCVGIFPVGSLVELNTGEVGIVLSHNRASRMQPSLMLVLDPKKQRHESPRMLDLMATPMNDFGVQYEIARSLEYGMYGIDPKDYYL